MTTRSTSSSVIPLRVRSCSTTSRHQRHGQFEDLASLERWARSGRRVGHLGREVRPEGATLRPAWWSFSASSPRVCSSTSTIPGAGPPACPPLGAADSTNAPAPSPNRTIRSRRLSVQCELLLRYLAVGFTVEDHVPAAPRHEAGVHLRADQQNVAVVARADHHIGELQAVDEAGALLADVEAGHVRPSRSCAGSRVPSRGSNSRASSSRR